MLSPEELLKTVNEIRRAGGEPELDKLLPGQANSPSLCLIAINLNFACSISPAGRGVAGSGKVSSTDKRFFRAAEALGWEPFLSVRDGRGVFRLPPELNDSAIAFDQHAYPDDLYQ